ncbi:MAG TPA: hypothetical protein VK000_11895 [Luteimonas sp.]|nr:hypothetical protein [Luteimonas sp.]
MEDAINSYLKRSFLSLFPRRRRRARIVPAARMSRFTPLLLPQAQAVPVAANGARRRDPHADYVRARYLSRRPSRAGTGQPLFRVA